MAEAGRSELARKLDKDLQEYISQLKPTKYEDGWPEDRWEEEMEKHPLFMSKQVEENQELSPLVEALQRLKYDPDVNTPEELAKAFKDDGNHYFKLKKYRYAVESYTQGVNAKCNDQELNSQLFANRAAAHFHIGNYKKSLNDCIEAKALSPRYMKVIQRGAECCFKLKQFEDCITWCTEGLSIDAFDSKLQDLRMQAEKGKINADRDKRKAAAQAARRKKEEESLKKAMKERGMQVSDDSSFNLSDFEPVVPTLSESRVHFDSEGCLIWPVMFLYPEYGVTDYIQVFHENSCMADHLETMFNEENRPSWDAEHKYKPEQLQVYFGYADDGLVKVDQNQSLKSILSDKRFKLHAGTPSFFITVRDSSFEKFWIKNGFKT